MQHKLPSSSQMIEVGKIAMVQYDTSKVYSINVTGKFIQ